MISNTEIFYRLMLSVILGGIVGWEREKEEKPAGLRTHIIVCLGSTLLMIVSAYTFPNADPTRIAAQVVTGIGFIGAGTILRTGVGVKGLTTAASIWTMAGVGLAVGAGLYIPAIITAFLIFLILLFVAKFEVAIIQPHKFVILKCIIEDRPGSIGKLGTLLGELDVDIKEIGVSPLDEDNATLRIVLRLPAKLKERDLVTKLSELENVKNIEMVES